MTDHTAEQLRKELEEAKQTIVALERKTAEKGLTFKLGKDKKSALSAKISKGGGLSVYGLGRWPVTLYKEQWLRLLGVAEDIKSFINNNRDKLRDKQKEPAPPKPA